MEIIVRQISGLGNQMFQYAAGRYYAHRYRATWRVAVDPPEHAFSYGAPRPFLLSNFHIRVPHATLTRLERILLHPGDRHRALTELPRRVLGVQIVEERLDQRHTFVEVLPIQADTRRAYLWGYWQTYKIVEAQEPALREEFALKPQLSAPSASVLDRIGQVPTPVSVHIRRGDYTLATEGNRVLPMRYYAEAMNRMRERFVSATFFVFSDDLKFARRELGRFQDVIFVDKNNDATAHEDLWLMSKCHHHIIANSSFSWWGAWLNSRLDKHVISPKQWLLAPSSYFPELLPPSWELIDVSS